jgi:hypothetical protein
MTELAHDVVEDRKRPTANYIAVCADGTFLEADSKKGLLALIHAGEHVDPTIIKGRRLPVTKVTRIVF